MRAQHISQCMAQPLQCGAMAGLQNQLRTELSGPLAQRTLHGPKNFQITRAVLQRELLHHLQKFQGQFALAGLCLEQQAAYERRQATTLALLQQTPGKCAITFIDQLEQNGVSIVPSLDQHAPGLVAASCAAADLSQKLPQRFLAAEVRTEQAAVGIKHGDKCHLREMMTFRQHLRPHKDARDA